LVANQIAATVFTKILAAFSFLIGKQMSRMNSRNRKRLYDLISKRDGAWCAICKDTGEKSGLILDHIDNDNSHNDLSNFQILCRSCNNKKNPRGPGKKKSPVYVRGDEYEPPRRPTPELEKSERCEPIFRQWLEDKVMELEKMEVHDVVYSGAEKAGCSPPTVNRYLGKMCSSEGKFEIYIGNDDKKYVRRRMQNDKPQPQQSDSN